MEKLIKQCVATNRPIEVCTLKTIKKPFGSVVSAIIDNYETACFVEISYKHYVGYHIKNDATVFVKRFADYDSVEWRVAGVSNNNHYSVAKFPTAVQAFYYAGRILVFSKK